MRSLVIVSLPRSFSSNLFRLVQRSLGVRAPIWVTEGEILNVDRYAHQRRTRFDEGAKFTTRARDPVLHAQLLALLDQVTADEDFVYKDVTQPFVLSAWQRAGRLAVIRIRRDPAEVAHSMLRRGWFYPCFAAQSQTSARQVTLWRRLLHVAPRSYAALLPVLCRSRLAGALIDGLAHADAALDAIPGCAVHFDELVSSEEAVARVLRALYPNESIAVPAYIDDAFRRRRQRILARRDSVAHRLLATQIARLRLT